MEKGSEKDEEMKKREENMRVRMKAGTRDREKKVINERDKKGIREKSEKNG